MKNNFTALKISKFFENAVFYAPVSLLVRTNDFVGYSDLFLLQALISFGICFLEIPSGYISEKLGYKKTLTISSIFMLISRILLFFAVDFKDFFIEGLIVTIAIALYSGTEEAYVFQFTKDENQSILLSKLNNYAEAGFIFSTISFFFLYKIGGTDLVLKLTIFAMFISVIFRFFLKDDIPIVKENIEKENPKSFIIFLKNIVNDPLAPKFVIMSGVISTCFILNSFFFIDRLIFDGISEENMTFIILAGSLLKMIIPSLLKLFRNRESLLFSISLILSAIFFIIISREISIRPIYIMLTMALIPIFINVIDYLIYEMKKDFLVKIGYENKMAIGLSYFGIFNDGVEFIILLMASLINIEKGFKVFFFIAIILILAGTILLLTKSKKNQFDIKIPS